MAILINLTPVEKTVQNKTFKDVNISNLFDVPVNYDLQSIKNRIANMFDWQQGTRILFPDFGNILEKIKYEPMTDLSMKNAEALIRKMFSYEPEVSITNMSIKPDHDRNQLNIRVEYEVPNLDITTTADFIIEVAGDNNA